MKGESGAGREGGGAVWDPGPAKGRGNGAAGSDPHAPRGGGADPGATAEGAASIEVEAAVERALAAVDETAEAWGADWQRDGRGGTLLLPVTAGIRRGWVRGRLAAAAAGTGRATRLALAVEESHYHLHTAAVVILLISAAGALLTVVWPFVPELLPIAPLGAILALGGWFLVVSRLRNSGPEEFFEAVAESVKGPERVAAEGDVSAETPPPPIRPR